MNKRVLIRGVIGMQNIPVREAEHIIFLIQFVITDGVKPTGQRRVLLPFQLYILFFTIPFHLFPRFHEKLHIERNPGFEMPSPVDIFDGLMPSGIALFFDLLCIFTIYPLEDPFAYLRPIELLTRFYLQRFILDAVIPV